MIPLIVNPLPLSANPSTEIPRQPEVGQLLSPNCNMVLSENPVVQIDVVQARSVVAFGAPMLIPPGKRLFSPMSALPLGKSRHRG